MQVGIKLLHKLQPRLDFFSSLNEREAASWRQKIMSTLKHQSTFQRVQINKLIELDNFLLFLMYFILIFPKKMKILIKVILTHVRLKNSIR